MYSRWILCLVAVLLMEEKTKGCDNSKVADCLVPFLQHPYLDNNSTFMSYSGPKLNVLCGTFKTARACFTPWLAECPSTEQRFLGGLTSTMKYICEETYNRNIEYHPCLSKDNVKEEGQRCQAAYDDKWKGLFHRNDSTISTMSMDGRFAVLTKYNSEYCSISERKVLCLRNVVKQFCGQAAAEWQATMMKKRFEALCPTIDHVQGCYASPNPKWSLAVTGLIIAVVIACLVCLSHTCKKGCRFRRIQHYGTEKPPPYDDISPPPYGAVPPPPYDRAQSPPSYDDVTHVVTVTRDVAQNDIPSETSEQEASAHMHI